MDGDTYFCINVQRRKRDADEARSATASARKVAAPFKSK
jgi:hypothetical protein